jgi:hypothetical protein
MKTTGDGFFIFFDSPARAVRGAAAMLDTATAHGLTARAGIHAGEVELQGDEVRGIAVHAAARVLDAAQHCEEEHSVGIGTGRRHRGLRANRRSAGNGSTGAYVRPDLAMGGDRCRRAFASTLGR